MPDITIVLSRFAGTNTVKLSDLSEASTAAAKFVEGLTFEFGAGGPLVFHDGEPCAFTRTGNLDGPGTEEIVGTVTMPDAAEPVSS